MEREFGNHRKKINISTSLAGQRLGIKEVDDAIWLVSFMDDDLEYTELEQTTLQLPENRLAGGCHPCDRNKLSPMSSECTLQDLERVKGIEPSYSAWKAAALPLSYTRMVPRSRTTDRGA